MGLGSIEYMGLDAARDEALRLRKLVKRGIDPLAQQEADRAANQVSSPNGPRPVPTFEGLAAEVIEPHSEDEEQEGEGAMDLHPFRLRLSSHRLDSGEPDYTSRMQGAARRDLGRQERDSQPRSPAHQLRAR